MNIRRQQSSSGGSRGIRAVLRGVLLSLLFAFGVGLAIGTWLRCEMEKPTGYLASRDTWPLFSSFVALSASPRPLDVGPTRAMVRDARQHKEQVREPVQIAKRRAVD